jgi:hypothetical protein
VALIVSVAWSMPQHRPEYWGQEEQRAQVGFARQGDTNSRFSSTHQSPNDLDCALISSVPARADQHRQEQRDEQVFPD